MSNDADDEVIDWMTELDETILEYLQETDSSFTASGIEVNLDEERRYGEIVESLSTLEENGFVEKEQWRYYTLTSKAERLLQGFASQDSEPDTRTGKTAERTDKFTDGTLEFLCNEARSVLNHQINQIENIDDKALRSVRITILILGLIAAAGRFEDSGEILNMFTLGSVIILFASVIICVTIYIYSPSVFGPGPEYIAQSLEERQSERKERIDALEASADWMVENNMIVEFLGKWFFRSQVLLAIGLFFLLVGLGLAIGDTNTFELADRITNYE